MLFYISNTSSWASILDLYLRLLDIVYNYTSVLYNTMVIAGVTVLSLIAQNIYGEQIPWRANSGFSFHVASTCGFCRYSLSSFLPWEHCPELKAGGTLWKVNAIYECNTHRILTWFPTRHPITGHFFAIPTNQTGLTGNQCKNWSAEHDYLLSFSSADTLRIFDVHTSVLRKSS